MADDINNLQEQLKARDQEIEQLRNRQRIMESGNSSNKNYTDTMFNSTNATRAFNSTLNMTNTNLLNVGKTLKEQLNPKNILDRTAQIENMSMELVRNSMGASRTVGDAFMKTLVNTTTESLKYGVTIEDNLNLYKAINDVMQVNTHLTNDQMIDMGVLANNAGVAESEIASIAKGFSDIGVGTTDAINKIGDMQKMARDYGLNVGQFMKTVGSNMKMLSAYNFKNGVEGFSRMLAKAQALRIDVSSTFSLSEKLLDPEQAIETAAGFQMLGGAIGDLGDPFKLLNMAQTDVAGLQDAMLGMAESAVVFDEETGEFDIPVAEMYRLREAAKLAGKSYEEFSADAIKAKKRTEKLEILDSFGRYDDKTKEMIASLAEFDGGELKVQLPGYEEAINVASLSGEQLTALEDLQKENAKSDRDIAMESMGYLKKMAMAQDEAGMVGVKVGVNTKGITDTLEVLESVAGSTTETLLSTFSDENTANLGSKITDAIANGFKNDDVNAAMVGAFAKIGVDFKTELNNQISTMPGVSDDNVAKSIDLQNGFMGLMDSFGTSGAEAFGEEMGTLFSTGFNVRESEINIEDANLTLSQRDGQTIASSEQISRLNGVGEEGTVDGNDVLLRPGKPDIFLNEDDMTLLAGTDLFGKKQNNMETPNLGMGLTKLLKEAYTTEPTQTGSLSGGVLKIEYDGPGIPITLEGDKISELSPRQLRAIFDSDNFRRAVGNLVVKDGKYGETMR